MARSTTTTRPPKQPAATNELTRLLRADHQLANDLVDAASNAEGEVRDDLLRRLVTTLSVHAAAEEQVVYPRLAHVEGRADDAGRAREEHQEMKELLVQLERRPRDEPATAATLARLRTVLEQHVAEEEGDLLPALEGALGAGELDAMADAFLAAKASAPTHPHPWAPTAPPLGTVLGGAIGVLDRLRDAAQRSFARPATAQDPVGEVARRIRGQRFAMVTSRGRDGVLRSRPMTTQAGDFDGAVWFFATADSTLVSDVEGKGGRVNVSYAVPGEQRWISLSGTGHLVDDRARARELWSTADSAWFPDGVDDPALRLVRVDVDEAEWWDAPGNPVTRMVGIAAALVTGRRPGLGRHEHADLRRLAGGARG